jgi:tRNA(fMet)-specific endonuclease VapC
MSKALLDSNAFRKISDIHQPILEMLETYSRLFVSPVVLGELFGGYKKGNREKKNKDSLEQFLQKHNIEIPKISEETAEIYAQIKFGLEKKGKPIPVNDIWIAAQAMENGAVLVTYDQHFSEIPGLRVWGE